MALDKRKANHCLLENWDQIKTGHSNKKTQFPILSSAKKSHVVLTSVTAGSGNVTSFWHRLQACTCALWDTRFLLSLPAVCAPDPALHLPCIHRCRDGHTTDTPALLLRPHWLFLRNTVSGWWGGGDIPSASLFVHSFSHSFTHSLRSTYYIAEIRLENGKATRDLQAKPYRLAEC